MSFSPEIFLGIDPTAGRHPFTWAALDVDCQLVALAGSEQDEIITYLDGLSSALVAVNAPPRPNLGLVRQKLARGQPVSHLRGVDMRLTEYILREHGISVSPTTSRPETCAAWIQIGFDVHRLLKRMGFQPYPDDQASRQILETNPHAVFCALLGQVPLPKPTLEGRLQRQLALYSQGAGINDPMDFFEEITRHRLLRGILPVELIYTAEELDALAAAFTMWCAVNRPEEVTMVGDGEEGQITLPIGALRESYS
jgi:predicted nuclease with RNAse H fold